MFAQIHYSQKLGSGPADHLVSIADAGCFLTAFSNLLERFGRSIDPPSLNDYFISHDDYLAENDGGVVLHDILAWGSVSSYDGTITTTRINSAAGGGWPDSNNAIVKFIYKSKSGAMVPHFCLVVDHTQGTIVDSWDGVVKHSPYGNPVAWATYEKHTPQTAATPVSPPAKYAVIENYPDGKQVVLNKQPTYLWGMNYDFDYMVNHPVETHALGEIWTVTNKVHHQDGYDYYRREGQVDGFNVLDCDDYAPPPPPPPEPEPEPVPVLPPAPNLGAITPPASSPNMQPYSLVTTVPSYPTQGNAAAATNSNGSLPPGAYYVANVLNGMMSLSKVPGQPQGRWINPADNVEVAKEPEPLSWMASYRPGNNGASVTYVVNRDVTIKDYAGRFPDITMKQYQEVGIYGTFEINGVVYYRPRLNKDTNFQGWYGVPQKDPETGGAFLLLEANVYDGTTSPKERKALGTANFRDQLDLFEARVKKWVHDGLRWFDIIPSGNKNKK